LTSLTLKYLASIDWLYSQLPIFQRDGAAAYKPGLDNTIALLKLCGNPEKGFKAIHVAGTNGKGSVSHMLAALFQSAGYKTGLYTSPHLKNFEERIKIDGREISKVAVTSFINHYRKSDVNLKPSFFELTMAMAFDYFKNEKVEIAIIETGMGGRLDSTNVLLPVLGIITNISLDHQAYLGDTIEKIAKEKAGIIKKNIPILIGERQAHLAQIFIDEANAKNSPLYFADETVLADEDNKGTLLGVYQNHNRQTVYSAYLRLQKLGYKLQSNNLKAAFENVASLTGLKGRYEVLQYNPKVIADTGHNEAAMDYIIPQLLSEKFNKLHLVLGFVNDKDVSSILKRFPKDGLYYFCKPAIPRGLDALETVQLARENGLQGTCYASVAEALQAAKKNAHLEDVIFVGGSTFVVAEIV